MQAAVQTAYGAPDVVVIRDIPKPVPKANEVLVRIVATTVTSGDARLRAFRVPASMWLPARLLLGIFGPRKTVLGSEYAGEVVATGSAVTRFKLGDRVFGMHVYGCHAEYKVVPETSAICLLPDGLDFAESAALPFGGLTALYFLHRAALTPGERVLVHGASGAVGSAAVQLARHMGAHVTAVTSARNMDLVRALGADAVIDYAAGDYAQSGARYDVVMDTVNTVSLNQFHRLAQPGARLLAVDAGGGMMLRAAWEGLRKRTRIVVGMATETLGDLDTIRVLAQSGAIRPTIDRTLPLARIAEGHALVDSGRKRGAVVITVASATPNLLPS